MIISTTNTVVDSDMTKEEILTQNPENPAPDDVLSSLGILTVEYYSFDGELHNGQIVINKNVISDVEQFFKMSLEIKFPIEKVIPISNKKYKWDDELSCGDNNSSGYNYRLIAGTNKMSNHAKGLAFDINPVQNVYIKYDKDMREIFRFPKKSIYREQNSGTLTKNHPLVILMKNIGWDWGGDWTKESGRTDYQHFEKNI